MVTFGLSIFILLATLWFLGWYAKRWVLTGADYLLAGRQVSLIPGIAGICGIAFAGSVTSIIPGVTIQYGFMGWVLGVSLPLAIGYTLYGLLACPYVRRSGAYTLPEWLEMRFDTRTRLVVSIATLLGVTGLVAMNVVAMALILTGFLQAPLWLMITVILSGHLMFILLGGFWALTLTDVVQVVLGFLLLPGLVVYCLFVFGGWGVVQENFVSSAPFLQGTVGSFPGLSLSYPSVLTVSLVLGIFIQWGGNYYWLRAAAARSEQVARWQYIIGGILVVLVVHGSLGVLGLYAGSVYREAFLGSADPMSAYGLLMRDFPSGIALFGLLAALAATISTTSNAHMGITSTLVRDIYQRFLRPDATKEAILRASRLLTLLTGVAIWLLCFYPGGPYFLLAVSCAMLGPAALVFLLGHRWSRMSAAGAFWGTLIGMVAMLVYEGLKLAGLLGGAVHTVIIGTVVTLPVILGVSLVTGPGQLQVSAAGDALPVNSIHARVLGLIRQGYTAMVEISDLLAIDAARGNRVVTELECAGLVQRRAAHGPDFFTFTVTPLGERRLLESSTETETPLPSAVDPLSLQVLEQVEVAAKTLRELGTVVGANAATLGAVVSRLDRLGYVQDGGIWERRVSLSPTGKKLLREHRQRAARIFPPHGTIQ